MSPWQNDYSALFLLALPSFFFFYKRFLDTKLIGKVDTERPSIFNMFDSNWHQPIKTLMIKNTNLANDLQHDLYKCYPKAFITRVRWTCWSFLYMKESGIQWIWINEVQRHNSERFRTVEIHWLPTILITFF